MAQQDAFIFSAKNQDWLAGKSDKLDVSVNKTAFWLYGVLPLVFGLVGITMTLVALMGDLMERQNLLDNRVDVTAQISDLTISENRNGLNYYVNYTFIANDQNTYEHRVSVAAEDYETLTIGDNIQIIYEDGNPSNTNIETMMLSTEDILRNRLTFVAMGGVLILIGGVALLFQRDNLQSAKKLAQDGVMVIGQVKKMTYKATIRGFNLDIQYKFESPKTGKEINTYQKYHITHLDINDLPAKGTPVKILYIDDFTYKLL